MKGSFSWDAQNPPSPTASQPRSWVARTGTDPRTDSADSQPRVISRPPSLGRRATTGETGIPTSSLSRSSSQPQQQPLTSLAASHAFQPTIMQELSALDCDMTEDDTSPTLAPPRPRRLWKISDTSLRRYPQFYPKPIQYRLVDDASPSVVAVRIAECLRRLSVSVEYDEEMATATGITVDRCHFQINLWRGVLVEVTRTRGDVITFHRLAKRVLDAACSIDSGAGDDERPVVTTAPLAYPRLLDTTRSAATAKLPTRPASLVVKSVTTELEQIVVLLGKDRLEAKQLGMERLVHMTDRHSSAGVDTALYASLAVLGAPVVQPHAASAPLSTAASEVFKMLLQIWVDHKLPGELNEPAPSPEASFSFSCATGSGVDDSTVPSPSAMRDADGVLLHYTNRGYDDEYFGGAMRSMSLRVLANALTLLQTDQPSMLRSVYVQSPQLRSAVLVNSLWNDVAGATRPPAVVAGTRLASQHEAVLAIRCLRVLCKNDGGNAENPTLLTEERLELLEKARFVGKSTHEILAVEAKEAYIQLTENIRSC